MLVFGKYMVIAFHTPIQNTLRDKLLNDSIDSNLEMIGNNFLEAA